MSFLNVMGMIFIVKCLSHLFKQHLGDEIEVPTLHGKVKLKIPAGTQTGTKFRLKGKGFQMYRGYGAGDQHIIVRSCYSNKTNGKTKATFARIC